jgi:hypothetical protein
LHFTGFRIYQPVFLSLATKTKASIHHLKQNHKMKKIFLLLLASSLLMASHSAHAQAGKFSLTNPNGFALDTLTNTTPKAAFLQVNGYMKTVAVQVTVTKISGVVAGTAVLQGSLDGVSYSNVAGASSFTLTDVASQTASWQLVDPGYLYYRVLFTGIRNHVGKFFRRYSGTKTCDVTVTRSALYIVDEIGAVVSAIDAVTYPSLASISTICMGIPWRSLTGCNSSPTQLIKSKGPPNILWWLFSRTSKKGSENRLAWQRKYPCI